MSNPAFHTKSLLHWAQEAGKGSGFVTTCRVTDASPSGTYAHTAYRLWQTDQDIRDDAPSATGVKDIASQLMEDEPGKNFKVIMGGGRQVFLPKQADDGYGRKGTRGDRKDLIQAWKNHKRSINARASYITNKQQLMNFDVDNNDYVLGLFQADHMEYHKRANASNQPTLAEMTALAIKMMQKEPNGYVLFIEGGRIDHGHHENKAHLALDETVQLSDAVETATKMTSEDDTLIVVTADHAHTMAINGYPARGSDIFTYLQGTTDNLTYSTLSYANGPNKGRFKPEGGQHNIVQDQRGDPEYTFQTINLLPTETHDGMDVAVYARGPWSHLFVGNYEQTTIPMAISYAARIGPAVERFNLGGAGPIGNSPWGRRRERPRPFYTP
ncbi:hypothetical protein J6590_019520 [Homalodisca vitripennis]|nr:hypothetical protein J6590_019520 [Homalodisca vitripennis]